MANSKTATLTLRLTPSLKEALCNAATTEHRSIANMIEVLIRDYCIQRGISISPSKPYQNNNNNTGGENT